MGTIHILLLCLSLTFATYADDRKYSIISEKDRDSVQKALLADIAPLLPQVMIEIGMPREEVADFCNEHQIQPAMLISRDAQIEYNYQQAQRVLAAIPPQYVDNFNRLTYQWAGPISLLRTEVALALALTPDQQEKVKSVCYDYYERLAPANRSDFSYQMTKEERAKYNEVTRQIESQRDLALLALLTPDQLNIWKLIIGETSAALANFREYRDSSR